MTTIFKIDLLEAAMGNEDEEEDLDKETVGRKVKEKCLNNYFSKPRERVKNLNNASFMYDKDVENRLPTRFLESSYAQLSEYDKVSREFNKRVPTAKK